MLLLSYLVVTKDFYRKTTSPHNLLSGPTYKVQREDIIDRFLFVFFHSAPFFPSAVAVCVCLCRQTLVCMAARVHSRRSPKAGWKRSRWQEHPQNLCPLPQVSYCSLLLPLMLFTHSCATLYTLIDSFTHSVLT